MDSKAQHSPPPPLSPKPAVMAKFRESPPASSSSPSGSGEGSFLRARLPLSPSPNVLQKAIMTDAAKKTNSNNNNTSSSSALTMENDISYTSTPETVGYSNLLSPEASVVFRLKAELDVARSRASMLQDMLNNTIPEVERKDQQLGHLLGQLEAAERQMEQQQEEMKRVKEEADNKLQEIEERAALAEELLREERDYSSQLEARVEILEISGDEIVAGNENSNGSGISNNNSNTTMNDAENGATRNSEVLVAFPFLNQQHGAADEEIWDWMRDRQTEEEEDVKRQAQNNNNNSVLEEITPRSAPSPSCSSNASSSHLRSELSHNVRLLEVSPGNDGDENDESNSINEKTSRNNTNSNNLDEINDNNADIKISSSVRVMSDKRQRGGGGGSPEVSRTSCSPPSSLRTSTSPENHLLVESERGGGNNNSNILSSVAFSSLSSEKSGSGRMEGIAVTIPATTMTSFLSSSAASSSSRAPVLQTLSRNGSFSSESVPRSSSAKGQKLCSRCRSTLISSSSSPSRGVSPPTTSFTAQCIALLFSMETRCRSYVSTLSSHLAAIARICGGVFGSILLLPLIGCVGLPLLFLAIFVLAPLICIFKGPKAAFQLFSWPIVYLRSYNKDSNDSLKISRQKRNSFDSNGESADDAAVDDAGSTAHLRSYLRTSPHSPTKSPRSPLGYPSPPSSPSSNTGKPPRPRKSPAKSTEWM